MTDRVDVMVDIESMDMNGEDGTIIQLSAVKFDLMSGNIRSEFNMYVDIDKQEMVAGSNSIRWWLETPQKVGVLKEILRKGKTSEKEVIQQFNNWLVNDGKSKDNVYLWGNGILDDNRVLRNKFSKYNLKSNINYNNHRDVRTLVDIVSEKTGMSQYNIFGESMDSKKVSHNALNDAKFQARLVSSCYRKLKS